MFSRSGSCRSFSLPPVLVDDSLACALSGSLPLAPPLARLKLNIQRGYLRIILDKVFSRRYLVSHKHCEYGISLFGVINSNLFQKSVLGIHGRFPELLRIHLSKALITLYAN